MYWNRKLLKKANLYLILDAQVLSYQGLLLKLKLALRAGVDIVQLRDKKANGRDILEISKAIKRITNKKALFILNDRVDLAILAATDGVHLGQEDVSCLQARSLMGPKALIGVSCQTLQHAQKAQRQGADYLGFGSVFKTKTKPDRQPMNLKLLESVVEKIQIPVFGIGGISLKNVAKVKEAGLKRVAVCREILLAKNSAKVVTDFKKFLD